MGRRHPRMFVGAAMVAALLAGVAPAAAGERIFVLSQAGAVLTELAVDAGEAPPPMALDKGPASIVLDAEERFAYVTHPDLSRLSVLDMRARRVTRTLEVPGSPFGLAIARDGRLFVGDWNGDHVAVLDAASGTVAGRVRVGKAPAHILLSPDERRLFVANRESDSVSVVDAASLAVEATIAVGKAPFAMALSPDAGTLYVGNVQSGNVTVIDTARLAVDETLASGAMPYGAAVTADGARILVTNQQAGTLAVLARSGPPAASIRIGGYPEGVAIDAGGTRAYVANWFSDDVSVVDLAGLKQERRIKVPAGPRAVVITRGRP